MICIDLLFSNSCGNKATSEDLKDTLSYSCANDSTKEKFSIQAFRYYGAEAGEAVYFHCVLRVCLADKTPSACECPSESRCSSSRKKRSTLDETKVYHVSTGPYILENDEEEKESKRHSFFVIVNWLVVKLHVECIEIPFKGQGHVDPKSYLNYALPPGLSRTIRQVFLFSWVYIRRASRKLLGAAMSKAPQVKTFSFQARLLKRKRTKEKTNRKFLLSRGYSTIRYENC